MPPGSFLVPTYFGWDVEQIRDRNGNEVPLDLTVNSLALFTWVVTPKKLLGGNYGFQVVVPFLSNSLELPRLGFENNLSLGLSDIYVQPVNLGWHTPRADYMAGLAFYAPTGSYEPGGNENRGLGMWSFELSGGSTLYFDRKQQWHASALAFYEIHTSKEDQDLKPGSILTIEGGLGGTFLKGALNAGLAYGAQWKVTEDSGDDFPSSVLPGKNHIYTTRTRGVVHGPLPAPVDRNAHGSVSLGRRRALDLRGQPLAGLLQLRAPARCAGFRQSAAHRHAAFRVAWKSIPCQRQR